ncbi:nucleoside transporter C-terminal domain-containing protein [Nocardioides sp. REDSEA-S30_B4]|uniref:NupC/NupG family nucleoside CNT transporter n=1 Tax=Nocardioides sp. REDSEA-S30_B4 TaxID=1811552 RepID=UPI0025F9A11F|nr:nucleoside transporter C-terminal domain-containing protein [Nocardioides sp. REDSEA-S30_B4]
MIDVLWGAGGMVALMGIAWLCSTDRRAVRPRTVVGALALQVGFGVLVLSWSVGGRALEAASSGVQAVIDSSREGIGFLFGPVLPAEDQGTVVAFQVLPVIVFFASLTAVLYHLGVLQRVVEVFGGGLGRLLGTGREESVNAAANIFVGQTEAPLLIRPYVAGLTRSQLFAVMVGGLSTVAGSVLVGYSLLGARLDYLIAASFMAAPGALLMAKIMLPEPLEAEAGDESSTAGAAGVVPEQEAPAEEPAEEPERARNVIDAAANGAADGLKLAATIGAMLLAFISLIALVNLIVGGIGDWFGAEDLSVQQLLGYLFAPVMSLIGVPWGEAVEAGSFVGQKIVLNEFVAFAEFGPVAGEFSDKTAAIVTFALTGFANIGSLGILLGGLGGIAPERRPDIASLGLRAILAATLANLMSAAIAGILIG